MYFSVLIVDKKGKKQIRYYPLLSSQKQLKLVLFTRLLNGQI